MSKEAVAVLVPMGFFTMVTVTAIGVPMAKAWARRMDRGGASPSLPPDVTARMERMEQALDSIAVEIERISEGQRFTTKLLSDRTAERPGDRAVGAGERQQAGVPAGGASA